jgi:hypothetical protein
VIRPFSLTTVGFTDLVTVRFDAWAALMVSDAVTSLIDAPLTVAVLVICDCASRGAKPFTVVS